MGATATQTGVATAHSASVRRGSPSPGSDRVDDDAVVVLAGGEQQPPAARQRESARRAHAGADPAGEDEARRRGGRGEARDRVVGSRLER